LLENGNLLRAGKDSLEIRDWDNNLVWSYSTSQNNIRQHHDIEPLPNGNVLCLSKEVFTPAEIIEMGRDTSMVDGNFRVDRIIELQPVGSNDANIVWEWHIVDHLIQDFDSTKPNFGVVENHPELLDLNFENNQNSDWSHGNAIDYNPELDQILLTLRHLSELYIIDHSTTMAEAAGHSGGNSNKGGDFLWRWGNPQVYRQGGAVVQKLHFPHDGKWVEEGYSDEGKITVFNNGGDGTQSFSSIHLLSPEIDTAGYVMQNQQFLPADYDWSWQGAIFGDTILENKKSGTQALQDGNMLICESSLGRISEITKTGTHLWSYRNPVGDSIFDQNQVVGPEDNSVYKAEKYPLDFPGFVGQDLAPQGLIENQNVLSDGCISTMDIEVADEVAELIIVNPVVDGIIQFNRTIAMTSLSIVDITGKVVYAENEFIGNSLRIDLKPAIYFIRLFSNNKVETLKMLVQ
jgi:hypothetical protein